MNWFFAAETIQGRELHEETFELFILFAETSQILLKISVIPINFHVYGSPESVNK